MYKIQYRLNLLSDWLDLSNVRYSQSEVKAKMQEMIASNYFMRHELRSVEIV